MMFNETDCHFNSLFPLVMWVHVVIEYLQERHAVVTHSHCMVKFELQAVSFNFSSV